MTPREMRAMLMTAAGILLLAVSWVIYVAIRPQEVTSGGGTASQYAQTTN